MPRDFAIHVDVEKFELVLTIDGSEEEHRFLTTDSLMRYLRSEIQKERYKTAHEWEPIAKSEAECSIQCS